eukprot:449145_1
MSKYFEKDKNVTEDTKKVTTNLFMEDMMNFVEERIEEKRFNMLAQYLLFEEYDTECIMQDIDIYDEYQNCNLLTCVNDIHCCLLIKSFIIASNRQNNQFSTGFPFLYHKYYKNIDHQQIQQEQISTAEQNNFGGHSVANLYVKKYYNSLKDEVMNCMFITMDQFKEKVVEKTNKFIETKKCKTIRCIHGKNDENKDPLHYGINYNTIISSYHLHAVILYCDFTDFCTDFSKSFRKIKWNESLESVKNRNSRYYHISKYLREAIQYYGVTGDKLFAGNHYTETGPFFTGMSFEMNIGSFSMRLNGPTSTSAQKEIAIRFAGECGILVKLNNNKSPAWNETFFNTSWISTFAEEDERLFFGGRYAIQIQSIILMKTKNNFKNIIKSLWKFDAILSGHHLHDDEESITSKDVSIVSALIQYVLGDFSKNKILDRLDKYIKDNWYLFTINKTQIVLSLHYMYNIENKSFIDLIMYDIQEHDRNQIA